VHGSLESTFWARECANCKEIMPLSERVCYCGGPVCIISLPLDKRAVSTSYLGRKMLYFLQHIKADADG